MTGKNTKAKRRAGWTRWWGAVALGAAVLAGTPASVWGQGADPNAAASEEATRLEEQAMKLSGEGKHDEAIALAERALSMTEKALGPEHPRVAQSLSELAMAYRKKGISTNDPAEAHFCALAAERLHLRALAIREKALAAPVAASATMRVPGPNAAAFQKATRLEEEAIRLSEAGKHDEAIALAERALSTIEKALGPEHPRVAQSLSVLAMLYAGKTSSLHEAKAALLCALTAEHLHQRALSIREKILGPHHPTVAMSLKNLAALYYDRGDYDQAEPLYKRMLAIWEKVLGPEHPHVATSLENLGDLYRIKGEYAKAEPLCQRALSIREKALGPEHPHVVNALDCLARTYDDKGDYVKAESLYRRALSICEKAFGPEHLHVAMSVNNLASVYQHKKDFARAEWLHLRALSIREKALGREHPAVAMSLNNLAGVYQQKGDYAKAAPLHHRALVIRKKALGPDHPDVATSFNNLAGLYREKKDYVKAELLYEKALSIRERALGSEHPDVATLLSNLAALYQHKGDSIKAELLYEKALSIREKVFKPGHPLVVTSLNHLTNVYRHQQAFAKVEQLYKRTLSACEKAFGPEHPHVIRALVRLADLYVEIRAYEQAQPLYERVLAISQKVLGPEHPEVVAQVRNLAALYSVRGERAKGVSLYKRRLAAQNKAITEAAVQALRAGNASWAIRKLKHAIATEDYDFLLNSGSEEERRGYMATLRGTTDAAISLHVQFAPSDRDAGQAALTMVLRRKGRLLDAMVDSLTALRYYSTDEGEQWLETLQSVRAQHSAFVWRGPEKLPADQYRATLDGFEKYEQQIEATLTSHTAKLQTRLKPVTVDQVRAAIPKGAALVEVFRYRPILPSIADVWGKPRYVAYVVHRDREPSFADLGEAAPIEDAANGLRAALSNPDLTRDPTGWARFLDALVMQPIRKLLGRSRHVFLSLDGALNLVPFGALVDERGAYLVKRYLFTYLTSGRDLLHLKASVASLQGPLVLADAAFDAQGLQNPAGEEDTHRGLRSVDMSLVRFSRLPSTANEARAIGNVLPDAQILLGAQATEAAIKAAHRPSILHIATHGFFLPEKDDADDAVATRGDEIFGLAPDSGETAATTQSENPLLRSGLGLAGANPRASGLSDDGILTALEVADLDLHGTELVVLSACETGMGKASSGDGVYGLRRSLVMAGAETQVMTLWKVDTGVTREIMLAYYDKLRQGVGRSAAMREVQLEMLRRQNRAHPNLWASFIVAGNPAPIRIKWWLAGDPGDELKVQPGLRGCACAAAGYDANPHGANALWFGMLVMLAVAGRSRKAGTCDGLLSRNGRREIRCGSR